MRPTSAYSPIRRMYILHWGRPRNSSWTHPGLQAKQSRPLYINGECVERVTSFKFLGIHISADLSWSVNTTALVKNSQQWLHFLRVLRKEQLNTQLPVTFYLSTIESLLTYAVWRSSCTEANRKRMQRVANTTQKIIGCPLPSLTAIYNSRCLSRARNIWKDTTHPASTSLTCCPLAGASGPYGPEQTDSGIASSPNCHHT